MFDYVPKGNLSGLLAHFFVLGGISGRMEALARIRAAAERVAASRGLELFDLTLAREAPGWVVRVTIDRPGPAAGPEDSVGIEDCALVSRELGTILDVEDPLDRTYTLEVTSPGLDRPLRHEGDFRRFAGRMASLVLEAAVDGQTFFNGRIEGVEGGEVVLLVGKRNRVHRIPLSLVKRARLDVEF
jgi:ribosome maturation factor RimP